jgi:prolipoprotein diacylglyceryltransferase
MSDGFDIPTPFLNQPFHIYFYGIMIMLGVVAATFLVSAEAKRRGQNPPAACSREYGMAGN